MPRQPITQQKIAEHVQRLGELYPPIALDSVDRTIKNPRRSPTATVTSSTTSLGSSSRSIATCSSCSCLLPDVDDTNKTFYADVWQPQEIQHGLILDRLQQDLGRTAAEPHLEVSFKIKILGALANLSPIQDVAKLLYFLTGASTERQAVLAYNQINAGMQELGESAIAETIITPIKQQEPGHFAFYQMSATAMIQDGVLKPWQLYLARVLREKSYNLVGTNAMDRYKADMGGSSPLSGWTPTWRRTPARWAGSRQRLLWANKNGMEFPPYILKALRESVDLYQRAERAAAA